MFSKIKRIGTTACKVQITVELKRLTILESKDCRSGLFIELERGSKSIKSTTRDSSADNTDAKLILQFDEALTVVMTLYKDSTGKYVEKKGKLLLKGYSKVTSKEVKLGSVKLSLNTLADDYEKKSMTLQFEDLKGRPMGLIDVSTTAKYLGDGCGDDDSSVVSGASRSTFSSASHMDIIQGLSGSGGSVAVNPYKRDRIGRFEELEAKAALAIKADHDKKLSQSESEPQQHSVPKKERFRDLRNNNDDDDDADVPLHSAFAAKGPSAPTPALQKAQEIKRKEEIIQKFDIPKKEVVVPKDTAPKEKDQGYHGSREAKEKETAHQGSTARKNEKTYIDSPGNPFGSSAAGGEQSSDAKDAEIYFLRQQLEEAKTFQMAMEDEFQTKITSMIERIIEIEDESDLDHYNHEQETIKILKAAGIYHKAGQNLRDADNNLTYSDDWADLFREQADEERIKVMALKKCLIRFSAELSSEDNQDLLDAGIALTMAKTPSKR